MNPFEWSGPGFLLFYVAALIGTLLGLRAWRQWREGGPAPKLDLADGYLVAYLRGQHGETVRVALVALIDRGLVRWDGLQLCRVGRGTTQSPLEQAILQVLAQPGALASIQLDRDVVLATQALHQQLEHVGLLPDRKVRARRHAAALLAIGGLLGMGVTRLFVGLPFERPVWLLVLAGGLTVAAVLAAVSSRRTVLGDEVLADLRTLLGEQDNATRDLRPGQDPGALALAAAAFGIGALPKRAFADHDTVNKLESASNLKIQRVRGDG